MKLLQLLAEIALLRLEMAWLWLQIWSLRTAQWFTSNPDEAAGAALGLLGALLLATRTRWAPAGWWAFLASNAALLACAWRKDLHGVFVLQLGFTCTSLLGIRNTLRDRFAWTEWRGDFEGNPTMWIMPLVHWRGRRIDLHKMVGTDMPGCHHTHPARAIRVVLWGGYTEEILLSEGGSKEPQRVTEWNETESRTWRPGMIGLVRPQLAHRIAELRNGRVSYSLWLRGRKTHKTTLRGLGWPAELRGTAV